MKFLGISFNISERTGKMIFPQFLFLQLCVILPSFAYQDGGLHITNFPTLKANILRTRSDIEKRSTAFFSILSNLSSEINVIFR